MSHYTLTIYQQSLPDADVTCHTLEHLRFKPSNSDIRFMSSSVGNTIGKPNAIVFLDENLDAYCFSYNGTLYFSSESKKPDTAEKLHYINALSKRFGSHHCGGGDFWGTLNYLTGMDFERSRFCDFIGIEPKDLPTLFLPAVSAFVKTHRVALTAKKNEDNENE